MTNVIIKCEYIWVNQLGQINSKTRVLSINSESETDWKLEISDIPPWSHIITQDGVRTPLLIRPNFACIDPNRKNGILVFCDTLNADYTIHASNTRARLIDEYIEAQQLEPLIGFSQQFFLEKPSSDVTGLFRTNSECIIDGGSYEQRSVLEVFLNSCISSGLSIEEFHSIDPKSKWCYSIGGKTSNAIEACDHLILSRFLLQRSAESCGYTVCFDSGSSLGVSISTSQMRNHNSLDVIHNAMSTVKDDELIKALVKHPSNPLEVPWEVLNRGFGGFYDERFSGSSDPYKLIATLIKVLGAGLS